MSVKGKRLIWIGAADGANAKPINEEGVALEADILPGMMLSVTATGLQKNANAATVFGDQMVVADKNQQQTRSVDDPWVINENMVAIKPRSGEFMNVLVAGAQNLTRSGIALTKNGAGLFAIAATDGSEEIYCYTDEAPGLTVGSTLIRVYKA